jgi:hypothetical protein
MSVLRNAKSKVTERRTKYSLTARVESSCILPGEISAARAVEKSAEAIVAQRAIERWKERRAEEQPRERQPPDFGGKAGRSSKHGRSNLKGSFPPRRTGAGPMEVGFSRKGRDGRSLSTERKEAAEGAQ